MATPPPPSPRRLSPESARGGGGTPRGPVLGSAPPPPARRNPPNPDASNDLRPQRLQFGGPRGVLDLLPPQLCVLRTMGTGAHIGAVPDAIHRPDHRGAEGGPPPRWSSNQVSVTGRPPSVDHQLPAVESQPPRAKGDAVALRWHSYDTLWRARSVSFPLQETLLGGTTADTPGKWH